MDEARSKFIKWLIPPEVTETHFKISQKVYQVAECIL